MCKGCERREKVKKSIFSGNTLKRGISALLAVCTAAVLFLSPFMGMEAQAAGKGGLSSQACQLVDRKTIEYLANFSTLPSSDDGMFYLYQLKTSNMLFRMRQLLLHPVSSH